MSSGAPPPQRTQPAQRDRELRSRWVAAAMLPVRWSGLALAAALCVAGLWVETAVALLVALAQVIAWRSRLPRRWEVALTVVALTAAISSYLRLYERISWWDIPVHGALNGLLAVLAVRFLSALRLASQSSPAGISGRRAIIVAGAVLAVVWELLELAGWRWVDSSVYVAPHDTALDIAAGLTGTVIAAALWHRRPRPRRPDERPV